jgi:putative nucleotidyltransferase with HDIG domain
MALAAERLFVDLPPAPATPGLWPEGHLERVARYVELLSEAAGLDEAAIATIRTAALVHEIGKLSVPEQILRKPGPLTAAEYEEIKRHAVRGAEICRSLPNGAEICTVVRAHHEHWDGQGYPDGLAGEAIPVGARILAIADAYDTLTMDRPFRGAFPPDEALEILWFGAETQWDPRLVELFERVMRPSLFDAASVSQARVS